MEGASRVGSAEKDGDMARIETSADERAGGGSGPMPGTAVRMDAATWGLLVALSLLWGGSFLFGKVAVAAVPPFTVVFVRVALAALALLVALRLAGHALPTDRASVGGFLVLGVLNNAIPFSLIFYGQTQIGAGLASILNAATPIFTVVVAHALTADEKATPAKLAGVALGFVGVAVLIGPSLLGAFGAHVWAELACLGAALVYAFASVYGRRFGGRPPLVTATGQLLASSAIMLPVMLVLDRPWTLPAPGIVVVAALAGLALLSTALAYVLYFTILKRAGATNAQLVTFLIPVSAVLMGAALLGERLEVNALAGFALIALGLAAVDGRLLPRGRRESAIRPSRGP